ncbi:hypothetical protein [Paludibacterium denitrificans]|uniref:hypothetical protein n=1 Tax=Paludibacterium denitrificans TaxID=2675226 RepID=UPI001E2FF6C7|nr:hypothetical protein [Paludibacterium denitrificans]
MPGLNCLAPLSSVPGIQLVSLQKGAGEDEALRPPAGLNVLPLGAELQDFADTAALISALDLVISVDTAVAHLARLHWVSLAGCCCRTIAPIGAG